MVFTTQIINAQLYVKINPSAGDSVIIGHPSVVVLSVTASGGVLPYSYSWSNGETNSCIFISPTNNETYKVTLTDNDATSKTDSIKIYTFKCPNGDFVVDSSSADISHTFSFDFIGDTCSLYIYHWSFGDGSESNLKNPSHKYNAPGTYIIDPYALLTLGCSDCSLHIILGLFHVEVKPLFVENRLNENFNIKIIPNPAKNKVTIEIPEKNKKFDLSIYNINGQELFEQQTTNHKQNIDITNFPSGLYFVKIINDKNVEVRKFVKE